MTQIQTERLLLRRARAEDVSALWDVFRRPEAMRYWSDLAHATPARTTQLVEGMMALEPNAPYFTVEHEGRAVGTAGFWQGSEVGYILHPDVWGKGLGSELLVALVRHGFEVCGFDSITADVDPDNAASIAMLTRAGFSEIGRAKRTLQIGDTWVDSVYFGLTAKAWSGA